MVENKKYNGWTNYETWKINLEFFDGHDYEDDVDYGFVKDEVENFINDSEGNETVKGWALSFVSEVDWQEIADGLNER